MSLKKAKKYLDKVNLLFAGISEDNHVSKIERDLMLNYLQQLYDAFYDAADTEEKVVVKKYSDPIFKVPKYQKPTYQKPEPPKPEPIYVPPTKSVREEPIYKKPEPPKEEPVYTPPKKPVEEKPTYKKPESVYTPPKEPVREKPIYKRPEPPAWKEPVHKQQPIRITPHIKPKIAEPTTPKVSYSREYDILFEEKMVKELSQKLSQKPVKDLKLAMGINERFLIINELFGGNANKFQNAINTLNGFSNFNQAKQHIVGELAPALDWTDEKRLKRAQEFIQKVRRRYL